MLNVSKLVLGTVQFGMPYGVANRTGQPDLCEVLNILHEAHSAGIDTLDTAVAYGESETVLGNAGIGASTGRWNVISKLPPLPDDITDVEAWVDSQVQASLENLGVNRLSALLLHRPEQLHGPRGPALLRGLQQQKSSGAVARTGISVYGPEELEPLFNLADFDIVQAPFSVLDHRMIDSGWAAQLRSRGVEFHARSVFLQGLLLMAPDERPGRFSRWDHLWHDWAQYLAREALSPLQACLGHALSASGAERIVIGVDSVMQLREIMAAVAESAHAPPVWSGRIDPDLVNPACWSRL